MLSVLLGAPPALLLAFWLVDWLQTTRTDATLDPHGYVQIFVSMCLIVLSMVTGLGLLPWTRRLVRQRVRGVWLPVGLNTLDLLPIPIVGVLIVMGIVLGAVSP